MIAKANLEDGVYYRGTCRNASVARWKADEEQFYYLRHKFGDTFIETIRHPEDDDGVDLFRPEEVAIGVPEIRFEDY